MKNLSILSILIVLVLTGCSPRYYTPNSHNVPLFSEQGETNLTLAGSATQIELQGAYAVTNKFAVLANGGAFIPTDENNGNGGSGKFFEVGGGYFMPVSTDFVFEVYGIIGFGSVENHRPSTIQENPGTTGDISASVLRYGIQPNFGYKTKNFSVAVSSRIVNLNYNNIKGDLIYDEVAQSDYLKDNSSNFLIEPALTIKGGFDNFKLQLQYGYSENLSNSYFRQDKSYLTLGLNYNFK
ncbi:hypothetical protein ACFSX9_14325 [Flavobacterium ardleyense]|uniref:Outer membrane protein beta-barrel domain-containing protein n=1 Tax=Flavobacterium ardleyense TaxID=2038737 RepID=A0ABW5ZBN3_9FLAO